MMKRLTCVLALLLMVVALPALASQDKSAKSLFDKGQQAEARQDYITAYNFYHQAYQLKPTDLRYRAAAEYVRFLAAASLATSKRSPRPKSRHNVAVLGLLSRKPLGPISS